jgi:hypothetical protein
MSSSSKGGGEEDIIPRLAHLFKELLQPGRYHQGKKPRGSCADVLVRVWEALGEVYKGAGTRPEGSLPHRDLQFPL